MARFGFAALAVPLLLSCAPVWATSEECEQEESVALLQVRSATTSGCTAADLVAVNTLNASFTTDMISCGTNAIKWLQFVPSKFDKCLKDKVPGLSTTCTNCFEQAAQYAYTNCKSACMWGACKPKCIACGETYEPKVDKCVGTTQYPKPSKTPC